MSEKVVLITGASSGFGLLTAIELAKRGFHVIATVRNEEKRREAHQVFKNHQVAGKVDFHYLDITSNESIQSFTQELHQYEAIDTLINNAGFALGGFAEEVSIEEYHQQFAVNFYGAVAVTQAVLSKMREKKAGKIINISSISGRIAFPGLSAYVSSKHALEGWTESLRLELKPFGIDVALVEPGSFQTNIWSTGKKLAKQTKNPESPYYHYGRAILSDLERRKNNHENPWIVAKLLADLCEKKSLKKLRYPIGKGVKIAIFLKNFIPWPLWEKIVYKEMKKIMEGKK